MADSSASGQRRYKPLKDQVEQLKQAIRMACPGTSKEAEKECQAMEAEVSKLFLSQQKAPDDRVPLDLVLKTEGERCEKTLKILQEECGGRSVNRKTKKEMKALKSMHGNCCKWMMMCNAVPSWMKEQVEKMEPAKEEDQKMKGTEDMVSIMKTLRQLQEDNKKMEDQMTKLTSKEEEGNRHHTPKIYPWIPQLPSAPPQALGVEAPPPYVMPMMTFEGGQVRGPDGQTGIVLGGIADVRYTGTITTTHPGETMTVGQPTTEEAGTLIASAAGGNSTSPQDDVTSQNSGEIGSHGEPHSEAPLTPPTEDMGSPDDVVRRPSFVDLPTPKREGHLQTGKSLPVRKDRWEGEVQGFMHEDRDAILAVLDALTLVKQKALRELAEEEITARRNSSEEEDSEQEDTIEGAASDPGTSIKLRNRRVSRDSGTRRKSSGRGQRQSVFDVPRGLEKPKKSKGVKFRDEATTKSLNLPLIMGPKHEPIYRAYKIRDLDALVKQLPPITEGGARWLRKLNMLTEGEEIAIGDFRGIAGRSMLGCGLADVEEIAGTTHHANNVPYRDVQSDLADAVREKYPTPNTGAIPKIIWDPQHTPSEFLARAKEQWMSETGIHPGREGESRAWFRAAVLAGLPKQVRTDLEKNPDFAVADSTQWERHVTHRLMLEQDDVNKQKKELEEAQALLLKLQLAEAKIKVSDKKKEVKEAPKKIMVVKPQPDPVPEWPDLDPNVYPDDRWPVNAPRQRQPAGNWGAVRPFRGRGGSARGGQRARATGNPSNMSWNVCYRCGADGHWARNCPGPAQNTQQRGYQTQARGAPRGRGAYRGGHQAPNPSAAPVAQYPVADWNWEEEQY
ncbi:TIMELESS-interacting protein [Sarotherodon galilaeus]